MSALKLRKYDLKLVRDNEIIPQAERTSVHIILVEGYIVFVFNFTR